jgi:hypothetical protein
MKEMKSELNCTIRKLRMNRDRRKCRGIFSFVVSDMRRTISVLIRKREKYSVDKQNDHLVKSWWMRCLLFRCYLWKLRSDMDINSHNRWQNYLIYRWFIVMSFNWGVVHFWERRSQTRQRNLSSWSSDKSSRIVTNATLSTFRTISRLSPGMISNICVHPIESDVFVLFCWNEPNCFE